MTTEEKQMIAKAKALGFHIDLWHSKTTGLHCTAIRPDGERLKETIGIAATMELIDKWLAARPELSDRG